MIALPLAAFLFIAASAAVWLLGTADGARWLVAEVSRFAPVAVEVKEVHGRLWGDLRMEGLKISWSAGRADVDEFIFRWRPGMLLAGRFSLGDIVASGVRVLDNRPEYTAPPLLSWPAVSGPLTGLDITVRSFIVKDFTYQKPGNPPVTVDLLSADILLHQGTLLVEKIGITMPQYRVEGTVTMGLASPFLNVEASLVPSTPLGTMDRFAAFARIRPGSGPVEAVGTVELAALSGTIKTAELTGELLIGRQSIALTGLRLFRQGLHGSVEGAFELFFHAQDMVVHGGFDFTEIDLSRELALETDLSGRVVLEGSIRDYRGTASIFSKGTGWRKGRIDASFRGGLDRVVVTVLKGEWLSGAFEGRAQAAWKEDLSLETALSARGLDPAGIAPNLDGAVNADLSGNLHYSEEKPLTGEFTFTVLESRVHGQPFSGEVHARLKGDTAVLDRFEFRGDGFEVDANGDWSKGITVAATVSDFSSFHPDAEGSGSLAGRFRRSEGRFAGEATARSSGFLLNGVRAGSADLTVLLDDRADSNLTARATFRDLSYDLLHIGVTSVEATGTLSSLERFILSGSISASGGNLRHHIGNVELKAEMNQADLTWLWGGESISGRLSVVLAGHGRIDAGFLLPVPARLPFDLKRGGLIDLSVKGDIQEMGALSFLFPGLVQESRGRIVPDIRVTGTWADPELTGSLLVEHAGAYLPGAGIRITEVRLHARMGQKRVRIESLTARSGPGSIEAKAGITLEGWRPVRFEGTLTGDMFQVLYLPEIRMLCSPRLEFTGTTQGVSVRGEVRAPELLITGPPKEAALQQSEDVVIIGEGGPEEGPASYGLDVLINVILGERVIVKAEGVDAQLGGEVLLAVRPSGEITGRGEISVVKGRYRTYGVNLEIARGRMLFAGGPVDNPTLDILALRTVGEVRAGVRIAGVLQKPEVSLYSEPSLPDADILAYVVLGHPLGQDRAQGDYVMQAAGMLLSAGQSVALQDQLQHRLGIDTIEIQPGEGEVRESLVTVGKYLSPKLYVSYGRSLFTGEDLFRMRYRLSKRWELETKSGEASGVDLYYEIRFD